MEHQSGGEIQIRVITKQDIAELSAALMPDVSASQVRQRWQEHQEGYREMLVAIFDGRPVGTVSIGGQSRHLENSLRMFALDVGQEYRRHGIGSALIATVEKIAQARGFEYVHLEVDGENSNAIRLYEKLGYLQYGAPFINKWTRIDKQGRSEEVQELSYTYRKRIRQN